MSKEKYGVKECIEVIKANGLYNPNIQKYFDELEATLTVYEAINNAEPTKALECLEKLRGLQLSEMPFKDECGHKEVDLNELRIWGSQLYIDFLEWTNTIKQALIQKSKKEQAWEIVKNKSVDMELFYDCLNLPITAKRQYYNYLIRQKMLDKGLKNEMLDFYFLTEEEFNLLKEVVE